MKKVIRYIVVLTALCCVLLFAAGNPLVYINNRNFSKAVKDIDGNKVELNDIVPFKWDSVYTFDPYTSKEDIESFIGFKSRNIKESVSEGMVQLLFVKDNRVVGSICGYGSSLGYCVWFGKQHWSDMGYAKIDYKDNASFAVESRNGILVLEIMEN